MQYYIKVVFVSMYITDSINYYWQTFQLKCMFLEVCFSTLAILLKACQGLVFTGCSVLGAPQNQGLVVVFGILCLSLSSILARIVPNPLALEGAEPPPCQFW